MSQRPVRPRTCSRGMLLTTLTIVALCVLVYVGQRTSDRLTFDLAFVPFLAESEPWRFLTAAFAHSPGSLLHIAFNMYALWITGNYLEPLLGRLRFLALYLVSAVGGSVGFLVLADGQQWFTPVVGASGAVFGLFAALLVLNPHPVAHEGHAGAGVRHARGGERDRKGDHAERGRLRRDPRGDDGPPFAAGRRRAQP